MTEQRKKAHLLPLLPSLSSYKPAVRTPLSLSIDASASGLSGQ
jgi:hypothetical protein